MEDGAAELAVDGIGNEQMTSLGTISESGVAPLMNSLTWRSRP